MFRAQVIGNLGSDAHVEQNNGRPFVSFNVAHNDRFTKEDGTVVEKMQWISCALNGDGGKLLPFLKKGRQVYVEGRCQTRVFSSEKERRMVAGVNLSVDHLELIGGQSDEVPSRLFDLQGVMHDVHKSYWIDNNEAAEILAGVDKQFLTTPSGQRYLLTAPCWVTPLQESQPSTEQQTQAIKQEQTEAPQQQAEEQVEVFGEMTEEQKKMQSKSKRRK